MGIFFTAVIAYIKKKKKIKHNLPSGTDYLAANGYGNDIKWFRQGISNM